MEQRSTANLFILTVLTCEQIQIKKIKCTDAHISLFRFALHKQRGFMCTFLLTNLSYYAYQMAISHQRAIFQTLRNQQWTLLWSIMKDSTELSISHNYLQPDVTGAILPWKTKVINTPTQNLSASPKHFSHWYPVWSGHTGLDTTGDQSNYQSWI